MKRQGFLVWVAAAMAYLVAASQSAEATPYITGGPTTLLSYSDAQRLETWLGRGSIGFTCVFSKSSGDEKTSVDFHAAVDGRGETFSIVEVMETHGNSYQIIGGYNPQSWYSPSRSEYYITPYDADRTAFLFNLTTVEVQRQVAGQPIGQYQTVNGVDYGPTFGVGHDLHVWSSLSEGSACAYSYGVPTGTNIIGWPHSYSEFDIGTIEIFEIVPVPLPSAALLSVLGLGAAGCRLRRQA